MVKISWKPKLQIYIQIKQNYSPERYVIANLSGILISNMSCLIAEFQTGILPLLYEVGRHGYLCGLSKLGEDEMNDISFWNVSPS